MNTFNQVVLISSIISIIISTAIILFPLFVKAKQIKKMVVQNKNKKTWLRVLLGMTIASLLFSIILLVLSCRIFPAYLFAILLIIHIPIFVLSSSNLLFMLSITNIEDSRVLLPMIEKIYSIRYKQAILASASICLPGIIIMELLK